jgi:hypothetical protein
MQREKLYILHTTACFTVATSVLKIDKILRNQIPTMQKNRFFDMRRMHFFLIYHLMFYLKKNKIHQKVQREKLYNFQRTVSFIYVPFGLKKSNF